MLRFALQIQHCCKEWNMSVIVFVSAFLFDLLGSVLKLLKCPGWWSSKRWVWWMRNKCLQETVPIITCTLLESIAVSTQMHLSQYCKVLPKNCSRLKCIDSTLMCSHLALQFTTWNAGSDHQLWKLAGRWSSLAMLWFQSWFTTKIPFHTPLNLSDFGGFGSWFLLNFDSETRSATFGTPKMARAKFSKLPVFPLKKRERHSKSNEF